MSGEAPGAVLFVCTENAIRSPMAAALFQQISNNSCYVQSAGVRAGAINSFIIEVAKEIDIDLSTHKPQSLAELQDSLFDIIITLSPEAHHQALELTRTMAVDVEYWPTMDPTIVGGNRNQQIDAYRACRDGLNLKIKQRFDDLFNQSKGPQ